MAALLCLGFTMRAQVPFTNEFHNLDDNQVPENWTFVNTSASGNCLIANGRIEAHPFDASGHLSRFGIMPNDVDSIVFTWDAIVNYAYWGQSSGIFMKNSDDKLFGFHQGFADYNYGSEVNFIYLRKTDLDFSNLEQIILEYMPVLHDTTRNILSITNNKLYYSCYKLNENTLHYSLIFDISEIGLLLNDINEIRYKVAVTTDNSSWIDNLKFEIFNSSQQLYFENENTIVGRVIEIPINTNELTTDDNVIAYQLDFNYDNTKLEYLSNTLTGTLAEGGSLQVNPTTGKLAIAWARETPMVGEGAIIKLQFKVIDAGTTTPTITNALYNTEAVNATNGTITATYKYGDIDANDHVQAYDAALAIQYSVGLDPLPTIDPLPWDNWRIVTANVDGVGGVTANDASEILKYTVGLIDKFPVEDTKKSEKASNADISVSVEDGEIILTSTGELFGLNVFVNENFSILGEPENFIENALFVKNISENSYAFGLATAYSPENNVNIVKIPYSTTQDQTVTFDFIVNTESKSVTVGLFTGIVTVNEQSVILYPNPANSVLYLKGVENVNITIFDINGRNVLNQKNVTEQIDISTLPKGVYTVKIENGNKNITRKLIKN